MLPVAWAVAWRSLNNVFTNPSLLVPSLALPALLLHRVRRRALAGRATCPASTSRRGYTAFQFVLRAAPVGRVRRRLHRLRDRARLRVRLRAAAAARGAARTGIVARLRDRGARPLADHGDAADGRRARRRDAGRRRRRRPLRPLPARAAGQRLPACSGRAGVAMRVRDDAGGAADADAGLPRALLRAGLRAARAPDGWIEAVATVNPLTPVLEAGGAFSRATGWTSRSRSASRSRSSWRSRCGRCAGCAGPRPRASESAQAGLFVRPSNRCSVRPAGASEGGG